jgi:hypothetical protein
MKKDKFKIGQRVVSNDGEVFDIIGIYYTSTTTYYTDLDDLDACTFYSEGLLIDYMEFLKKGSK